MALRRAKADYEIVGHTRSPNSASRAQQLGAIDRVEWNLPAAVEHADIVLVATPVLTVKEIFAQIAPYLRPGTVVTDVASTKQQVMAWADELLPPEVSFVGGHPMAGKERAGIEAADAALFQGCTYCILAGTRATDAAVDRVVALATAVGGRPFFVEPEEHDSFVAAISHLPFILSAALVNTVAQSPSWRDASRLAAGGFRDVSRLASGDPVMHRDICLTNQESIRRWIRAFREELDQWEKQLDSASDLLASFERAKEVRDAWLAQREQANPSKR